MDANRDSSNDRALVRSILQDLFQDKNFRDIDNNPGVLVLADLCEFKNPLIGIRMGTKSGAQWDQHPLLRNPSYQARSPFRRIEDHNAFIVLNNLANQGELMDKTADILAVAFLSCVPEIRDAIYSVLSRAAQTNVEWLSPLFTKQGAVRLWQAATSCSMYAEVQQALAVSGNENYRLLILWIYQQNDHRLLNNNIFGIFNQDAWLQNLPLTNVDPATHFVARTSDRKLDYPHPLQRKAICHRGLFLCPLLTYLQKSVKSTS